MKTFPAISPGETPTLGISFRRQKLSGELAQSCIFKAFDTMTGEEVPAALDAGAPDITAWPIVRQRAGLGVVEGKSYYIEATVTTNKRIIKGRVKLPVCSNQ